MRTSTTSREPPVQLKLFGAATLGAPSAGGAGDEDPAERRPTPADRQLRPDGRLELLARLRALLPGQVRSLMLTDNGSSILSARGEGALDLRVHRCFTGADDETLGAVAAFFESPRRSAVRRAALRHIRAFFARHRPPPLRTTKRRIILRPLGRTLDLRDVRDRINREYFGGKLEVEITWGRAATKRRYNRCGFSVRLGSYTERDRLIRIHRCLDRPEVPAYVVEAVVHHELLHAHLRPVIRGGRRYFHTPEFRRREKLFRHHVKAERWLARHLSRLIKAR